MIYREGLSARKMSSLVGLEDSLLSGRLCRLDGRLHLLRRRDGLFVLCFRPRISCTGQVGRSASGLCHIDGLFPLQKGRRQGVRLRRREECRPRVGRTGRQREDGIRRPFRLSHARRHERPGGIHAEYVSLRRADGRRVGRRRFGVVLFCTRPVSTSLCLPQTGSGVCRGRTGMSFRTCTSGVREKC